LAFSLYFLSARLLSVTALIREGDKGNQLWGERVKWGTCNGLWHRNEVPGRKPLSESKLMIPTQIYGQPDKGKWKKVKEIKRVKQKNYKNAVFTFFL